MTLLFGLSLLIFSFRIMIKQNAAKVAHYWFKETSHSKLASQTNPCNNQGYINPKLDRICWISLKFTEKYYKKLSFSIETNPFHVLWFEKFRSLISRSRTTKRATLLYIQGIIVIVCCCVNFIFVRLLNIRIYLLLN